MVARVGIGAIPVIKRDGRLLSRLLVIVIAGFDDVLDRESQLYLRLLTRLIDKAFDEYSITREYIAEEIKTNDKLAYRYEIINHLENCVGAISRASKIFDKLANGVSKTNKSKVTKLIKKDLDIYKLISLSTKEKITKSSVIKVRNKVEHIDEDIYLNKFKAHLFLDVDDGYKQININNKSVSLVDLTSMIERYHQLMLEVYSGLPNKWENGQHFKDEVLYTKPL